MFAPFSYWLRITSQRATMGPSRSSRNKAKQTRLEFQPLSPSASVKKSYATSIQDRLANVRFRGSRPRARSPSSIEGDQQSLPTPQATSPARMGPESELIHVPVSHRNPLTYINSNSKFIAAQQSQNLARYSTTVHL